MDRLLPQPENGDPSEDYANTVAQLPYYEYRALDKCASEIRLLSFASHGDLSSIQLKPCVPPEESEVRLMAVRRTLARYNRPLLRCHIEHALLIKRPRYSVLSYTWGDASNRMAINVDDRILLVTENLYSALAHVEFPNKRIWIDAICIYLDRHQTKYR